MVVVAVVVVAAVEVAVGVAATICQKSALSSARRSRSSKTVTFFKEPSSTHNLGPVVGPPGQKESTPH